MYLKAGAKVCSEPAIDLKFRCTDWLTILDVGSLDQAFAKKFSVQKPQH
jgi:putative hemolysin